MKFASMCATLAVASAVGVNATPSHPLKIVHVMQSTREANQKNDATVALTQREPHNDDSTGSCIFLKQGAGDAVNFVLDGMHHITSVSVMKPDKNKLRKWGLSGAWVNVNGW